MEILNPEQLAIYKFEPDNILMIHKTTKVLYQYLQTPIISLKQSLISHNNLEHALLLPTGILYKKFITNMGQLMNHRIKMISKNYFEQEELVNTFSPIIQCLEHMHSKNQIHRSLCPQIIGFDENGTVKLKDGSFQIPNNKYYSQTQKLKDRKQSDDFLALGNILLEAVNLTQLKQLMKQHATIQSALRKHVFRYSRGFLLFIFLLLKRVQRFYPFLLKILSNNGAFIDSSEQLVNFYKRIKGEKDVKMGISLVGLGSGLTKGLSGTLGSKKPRIEQDTENKRSYPIKWLPEESRKTLGQRGRQWDMALKRMSNLKLNVVPDKDNDRPKLIKEEVLKFNSPNKRLRTLSKKNKWQGENNV